MSLQQSGTWTQLHFSTAGHQSVRAHTALLLAASPAAGSSHGRQKLENHAILGPGRDAKPADQSRYFPARFHIPVYVSKAQQCIQTVFSDAAAQKEVQQVKCIHSVPVQCISFHVRSKPTSWSSSFQPVFLTGHRILEVSEEMRKNMGVNPGLELITLPYGHQLRLDIIGKVSSAALYFRSFQLRRAVRATGFRARDKPGTLCPGPPRSEEVWPLKAFPRKPIREFLRSSGGRGNQGIDSTFATCCMGRWRSRQRLSPGAQVTTTL